MVSKINKIVYSMLGGIILTYSSQMAFASDDLPESWAIQAFKKEMAGQVAKGSTVNTPLSVFPTRNAPKFEWFVIGKSSKKIKQMYIDEITSTHPYLVADIGTSKSLYQFENQDIAGSQYKILKVSYVYPYGSFSHIDRSLLHSPVAYYLVNANDECVGYSFLDDMWISDESPVLQAIKKGSQNVSTPASLLIPQDKELKFYNHPRQDGYIEKFAVMNILKAEEQLEGSGAFSQTLALIAFFPQEYSGVMDLLIQDALNNNLAKFGSWVN